MKVLLAEAAETAPAVGSGGFGRLGDERLAWLVARGQERAFTALYERYHQRLYRYCRSIVRDESDAQDALQSTFASALSSLRRQERPAPWRAWLFRIAHNESVSILRRRVDMVELTEDDGHVVGSAHEQLERRERFSQLLSDLGDLPERMRGALLMRELSGLTHEEIALALDTSVGAAKQAVFDARKGLHELAEGRALACEEIQRRLSDGDRRMLRARRVRGHVRGCEACAAFAVGIPERRAELRALTPVLPATGATALLTRVVGPASGRLGAGASATASSATVKVLGGSLAGKVLTGAAIAVVAAGAATVSRGRPEHRARATSHGHAVSPSQHSAVRAPEPASRRTTTVPAQQPVGARRTGGRAASAAGPSAHRSRRARHTGPRRTSAQAPPSRTVGSAPAQAQRQSGATGRPLGAVHGKPGRGIGNTTTHGGTPPGHSGTRRGRSGTPRGHSGTPRGHSGAPPGHAGSPPGHTGRPNPGSTGPSHAGGHGASHSSGEPPKTAGIGGSPGATNSGHATAK
jgi:RNA polymerase sigma factor (sigma-70 family)